MSQIIIDNYSEKAIVVRNTLEHHGPIMTQLGGTFNEKLKGGRGWIFSKYKFTQVQNIVTKLNSGQYGNEYEQKSGPSVPIQNTVSGSVNATMDVVSKTEFLSVVSRLERMEALVANLLDSMKSESIASVATTTTSTSFSVKATPSKPIMEEDFNDVEDDDPPMERKRMVTIVRK